MEEIKKLHRSKEDRIIAGVCGGLGEYFKIDPVLFRILFVLLTLSGGAGVLLYIILILIVPCRDDGNPEPKNEAPTGAAGEKNESKDESAKTLPVDWASGRHNLIAFVLILIGVLALFNQFFHFAWFRWGILWPALIIVFGFYLIFKKRS